MAAAVAVDGNHIRSARLAMGGVAHKPWRLAAAEAALRGVPLDEAAALRAAIAQSFADARPLAHNGFKVELAKQNVELVVRAHEAMVDRTTLPVQIVRFKDFPDGLDVAFADGQRDVQVEVSWKKPEAPPRGPDDKDKKGGSGDH